MVLDPLSALPAPVLKALVWAVFALGLIGLGGVLLILLRGGRRFRGYVAKPLLTENERQFYWRLVRALPDHVVLAQVAMGALIGVAGHVARKDRWRVRASFSQKIVDFVVDEGMRVVALVELDDRSHEAGRDRARDAITAAAGYRTVRFWSGRRHDEEEIRSQILQEAPSRAALFGRRKRARRP